MYIHPNLLVADKFDKTKGFQVKDLKSAAESVCVKPDQFVLTGAADAENKANEAFCLDLGFMYSLLRTSYDLSDLIRMQRCTHWGQRGFSLGVNSKTRLMR